MPGLETGGRFSPDLPKNLRAFCQRSRLYGAGSTTTKTVEGGTSYFSRWETENALGPAEKHGVVRVNLCQGSWLLEPLGPNATRATYMIYTDSGGVLPAFIKNTGSQIGLRKMFVAIRKQVLDPKYTSEKR